MVSGLVPGRGQGLEISLMYQSLLDELRLVDPMFVGVSRAEFVQVGEEVIAAEFQGLRVAAETWDMLYRRYQDAKQSVIDGRG